MTYKALYRKYRPKTFNDIAGQQIVVQILKNSIVLSKISHAYLFYGPRGTGKTSIAKIFAKSINCEKNCDGISCGKCKSCVEIENNTVDIIEIDAASNNGVDEIRELKSKVNLVPSSLKYKVYIIDEVHMLSIGAFNALLKTLEEPPAHVIFILATTELNKVPETIISRCQLLEFKKISDKSMFEVLKKISNIEKINITDDAIFEIIKCSDGGLRDALGLLDKLSLYPAEVIDADKVKNICGSATFKDINVLIDYIKTQNIVELVDKIESLYFEGVDLINIAKDMIYSLQEEMISDKSGYCCSLIIKINDIIEKLKKTSSPKIVFEASLIKIMSENSLGNISREIFPKKNKQQKEEKSGLTNSNTEKEILIQKTEGFSDFKIIRVNNAFVEADKILLKTLQNMWEQLKNYIFDSSYGSIASLLIDSIPVVVGENYVILMFKYDSLADKANSMYFIIEEFLTNLFNKKYKIVALSKEEWEKQKKEYIIKIKNKEVYVYIDDSFEKIDEERGNKVTNVDTFTDLTAITEELFGKENVIIN